ncbi:MAG: hypothetical protein MI866_07145 [Bacteroidales bacterium]|nr:hypothetical protein [Bacteroidales bacterium]
MNKYMILISLLLSISILIKAQKADEEIAERGRYVYSLPDNDLDGLKKYNGEYLYFKKNEERKLYDCLNAEFKAHFGENYPPTLLSFKLNNNGLLIDARIHSEIRMDQEKVYSFLSKVVSDKVTVQLEPFTMFDPEFKGKDYYVVFFMKLGRW